MRAIAVDWSGARRFEQRHLWLAQSTVDGRLEALAPMTRKGAVDAIVMAADRDPDLIAGLDFAFSMPRWWLRRVGVGDAGELWRDALRLEGWLEGCPYPFWGRPGRRRPLDLGPEQQWRRTELATRPRPKSVFQIGGAGSVGTGSLRGMPALARLRRTGFSIWPFDPPRLPMVVEMWPRLFTGPVVKSSSAARAAWLAREGLELSRRHRDQALASEDAFDAAVSALALTGAVTAPACSRRDETIRLEGWIWGVPNRAR